MNLATVKYFFFPIRSSSLKLAKREREKLSTMDLFFFSGSLAEVCFHFFSFKRFRYLFVSFKSFSCYDDFCLRLGAMWCYIVTIQRKKRKLVRNFFFFWYQIKANGIYLSYIYIYTFIVGRNQRKRTELLGFTHIYIFLPTRFISYVKLRMIYYSKKSQQFLK